MNTILITYTYTLSRTPHAMNHLEQMFGSAFPDGWMVPTRKMTLAKQSYPQSHGTGKRTNFLCRLTLPERLMLLNRLNIFRARLEIIFIIIIVCFYKRCFISHNIFGFN